MKWFDYADEKISDKEIMIAVPSIVIGVGILSMPRELAGATTSSDGWISIVIGGTIFVFITWMVAKLAASFPNQQFLTYASSLVTKPVAVVLTFLLSVQGIILSAYVMRVIAEIAKEYLFDETPVEVIALTFLLVVVYAVSGSRAGLFRLNMMFFPIIVIIAVLVIVFSLGWFNTENLLPVFKTSFSGHLQGLQVSSLSYIGFGIVLFYTALVKQPAGAPRMAAIGMSMAVGLYLLFFIVCLGVFGNLSTANLIYPTIELAKEIEIPGGFFERFDSVFLTIWIMAIFNTTAMGLDVAVFALNSLFNVKKAKILFVLSPLVYFIGMFPKNFNEVVTLGAFVGYYSLIVTVIVTIVLLIISKIKGGKKNGKK
ncbi:endospore germination permease [Virgibacillus sp. C22-A2]|uniref:Endospore germination permease n=1 Tax=Virgibacillus tibetensis TaxID=3042313 RepID=A0ABU6KK16_9BACI|nr:endospore germination permease [Virgibacillus sp. C22-A2]